MKTMAAIKIKIILVFSGIIFLHSCIKDRNFDTPENLCISELVANASYAEIKNMYIDETIQIQQDLIIEGYVISSDQAGNFFSVLHFQDSPTNPTEGFQIEIDVRDSHLFYPVGSKILIRLKGLFLGKSKAIYKIGGVFTSFGNVSVGRLPAAVVDDHIFIACEAKAEIQPTQVTIDKLPENSSNILIQFNAVEIIESELGKIFATEREETERTLIDCNDNKIALLNSGFANFQSELLPEGNGTIKGILLRENNKYRMVIRDLNDIDFSLERCEALIDEFTSTKIIISELADPDNNAGARFIELYNSNSEPLSLKGWKLNRYTNENTIVSSTTDLSDHIIEGEGTFVISPNAMEYETVYGFEPDLGIGINSPADSNGDDNFELVDPFGTVIDTFGVIGEDGTGTNHEFEDGRAVRNVGVTAANPIYDFSEWTIYNDSGNAGTINQPQIAPTDFTPGVRN